MAILGCKLIDALDTIDEVSRVITCMGVAVAARALDEYESSGVTVALHWSTQRLVDCSNILRDLVLQDGKAPN